MADSSKNLSTELERRRDAYKSAPPSKKRYVPRPRSYAKLSKSIRRALLDRFPYGVYFADRPEASVVSPSLLGVISRKQVRNKHAVDFHSAQVGVRYLHIAEVDVVELGARKVDITELGAGKRDILEFTFGQVGMTAY